MSTEFAGVAQSRAIRQVLDQAAQFASIPRPILIRGERGTGKELMARYIHQHSNRADKPFVTINCAAFNDELLNAEIYGHEKGAFTGATETRIGKLEQADTGTLFMDEIGNMSPAFQDMFPPPSPRVGRGPGAPVCCPPRLRGPLCTMLRGGGAWSTRPGGGS